MARENDTSRPTQRTTHFRFQLLQKQRFEFGNPHGEAFHRDRFDAYLTQGGSHEIVPFVTRHERDVCDRGEFGFELFLGPYALGGVGQLFKIVG